jgi:nucleoside-diphosphate-sugar epimerase
MNLLVTGVNGFIGRALHDALRRAGDTVVAFPRMPSSVDLVSHLVRESALDTVVHLAARVHVMHDSAADPLMAFREVNVDKTLQFAAQAAAAGVRRFVFVSSAKVHGEATERGRPFTERDTPAPQDAYAISKREAEQGLRDLAARTGMEVVIIRPPLVYGPGVKANFAALMRAVQRGVPLPLGAVDNLRSLVGLDNLVDFIITCARHPAAANQTFLVSDGVDVSTPALVRAMARAAHRPARLVFVPVALLSITASLIGKRAAVERVCQSLQLDMSKARRVLQWTPPVTFEEGLRRAFAGVDG